MPRYTISENGKACFLMQDYYGDKAKYATEDLPHDAAEAFHKGHIIWIYSLKGGVVITGNPELPPETCWFLNNEPAGIFYASINEALERL